MYPKLLSVVIVKLIWILRGIKNWFVVHSEENNLISLYLYNISPSLRNQDFISQHVSERRLWRWYSVLHKVEAKTCHLKLSEVPVVKRKMFMLYCFRTQPPSLPWCLQRRLFSGRSKWFCKSCLTTDKNLYSSCNSIMQFWYSCNPIYESSCVKVCSCNFCYELILVFSSVPLPTSSPKRGGRGKPQI